jgi:hypothetical protein
MRAVLPEQFARDAMASREASSGDGSTSSCRSTRSIARGSPEAIAPRRAGDEPFIAPRRSSSSDADLMRVLGVRILGVGILGA